LVVHLSEQAGSTGYSWTATATPSAAKQVGEDTVPPTSTLLGAAGEHVFTYRMVSPGAGSLGFALVRPWEPASPVKTVTVALTVRP
jgi:predicted secreted protein